MKEPIDGERTDFQTFEHELVALHHHFSHRLPRYTSYPTAVQMKHEANVGEIQEHFCSVLASAQPISLYVHIPFCHRLCYFCACNKIITSDEALKSEYLILLKRELLQYATVCSTRPQVTQIHLGGGSPAYLSLDQLTELDDTLKLICGSGAIEKSIEIDCRTFDEDKLSLLIRQGYCRFSLGVQDFDRKVQKLVNREQSFELIRNTVYAIRRYEKTSINFDLIYGLPGQTLYSFADTLERVVDLSPDRIALYGYADVSDKVKVQRVFHKYGLPGAFERIRLFHLGLSILQGAGYRYIGLDHFAKPVDALSRALDDGSLRRNFMGYTTQIGENLLGIGLSAISDSGGYLAQKFTDLEIYEQAINSGLPPFEKALKRTIEDKIRGYCIEAIMCRRFLSLAELLLAFSDVEQVEFVFLKGWQKLKQYVTPELAVCRSGEIEVTERGALYLRYFASVFDAYLPGMEECIGYSSAV